MLYGDMLKRCKENQKKDYKKLQIQLKELATKSNCEHITIYKELANYILTDSNRWIYLSKNEQYIDNNVNSITWFLFKLKYAVVNSGDITSYWKECVEEFDGSIYLEPKLDFIYSEYLIQDCRIKRENIIPIKDFVSVLKKHNQDLVEQEKLNEKWELANSL